MIGYKLLTHEASAELNFWSLWNLWSQVETLIQNLKWLSDDRLIIQIRLIIEIKRPTEFDSLSNFVTFLSAFICLVYDNMFWNLAATLIESLDIYLNQVSRDISRECLGIRFSSNV